MTETLAADYFDGETAQARRVMLSVSGGQLHIDGEHGRRDVLLRHVRWPERQRHGARLAQLPEGGQLQALDATEWDAWCLRIGLREPLVVRLQQRWRSTFAALGLVLVTVGVAVHWGIPCAAGAVLPLVPPSVDQAVGQRVMQTLHDQKLLAPSKLPPARQEALRAQLLAALARDRQGVPVALHFRSSKDLGPNAIALPGGSVVITDELVELLHDQPEVLIGVVGHERGHVQHRHGMRDLLQATLLSAGAGLAFGDFSGLLASAPVLLAQLRYSRDFEREADGEAIQVLHANGISPAVMAVLFERLRGERDGGAWPAALGSHPDDDERIETFRKAR